MDMPSEPAESNFKNKVRAKAYPTQERNGIIWAYMGPLAVPPPLPELLPNLDPECRVWTRLEECNYMQALEGDIDTVHAFFLHSGHVKTENTMPGSIDYYITRQREARLRPANTKSAPVTRQFGMPRRIPNTGAWGTI